MKTEDFIKFTIELGNKSSFDPERNRDLIATSIVPITRVEYGEIFQSKEYRQNISQLRGRKLLKYIQGQSLLELVDGYETVDFTPVVRIRNNTGLRDFMKDSAELWELRAWLNSNKELNINFNITDYFGARNNNDY